MGYIPTVRFRSDDLNTIINGLDSEQVKSVTFQKFLLNIEQSIKRKKINTVFCYVDDDFEIVINEKVKRNHIESQMGDVSMKKSRGY
jgi:hypothetical protein